MNSTKTRIAAVAATGAALGLGMFMAQSATAVAAPAQSTFPQVASPESGLSPYKVDVRDRIGCANAWPMVSYRVVD